MELLTERVFIIIKMEIFIKKVIIKMGLEKENILFIMKMEIWKKKLFIKREH